MAVEVLFQKFTTSLNLAISDNVDSVSDSCYSKGLISKPVHEKLTQSRDVCSKRARKLISAVEKSIMIDNNSLEIFFNILEEQLPVIVKEKLLPEMKSELTSIQPSNACQVVVPISGAPITNGYIVKEEFLKRQESLMAKYSDSVKLHTQTFVDKAHFEVKLKEKTEEGKQLRGELENLKVQMQEGDQAIVFQNKRISQCEDEIKKVKEKISSLESVAEQRDMELKRSKTIMFLRGAKLYDHVQRQTEEKYRFKELETQRKTVEQLKVKDLQHQIEIKDKELQIKELKLQLHEKPQPLHDQGSSAFNHQRTSDSEVSEDTDLDLPKLKKKRSLPPHMSGTDGFVPLSEEHHGILLKQLKKHASDWKSIGTALGFTLGELGNIEGRPLLHKKSPLSWLDTMIEEWLHWNPGDSRRSGKFATLEDLKVALRKAKLRETAKTLTASLKTVEN